MGALLNWGRSFYMAELPNPDRVNEFLAKVSENDKKGLVDLQNLSLSMGLPAARATFMAMIEAAQLRGKKKTKASNMVRAFSPVTEHGCMQVDFRDKDTGAPRVMYMVLDECPQKHNLDAELDKLKPHATEEKWGEILKHLSYLVYLGRMTYCEIAKANVSLIRKIFGLPDSHPCTEYLSYKIDPSNTTLYIDPGWPTRIGIFIREERT